MPYTLTPRANHTVELTARLAADVVERERQSILDQLRRRASVPGFRPGKAPLTLVRSRFAEEIHDQLEDRLSDAVWREVLEGDQPLQPITMPRVQDRGFDPDGSFRYVAAVEVRPRFELPDVAGLSLSQSSLEVSGAEIEAELEKVRQEHGTWVPADEESAAEGLLVEADIAREVEGEESGQQQEERTRFVLGDAGVPPEIGEALRGARVGEVREAARVLLADEGESQGPGKTVRFRMRVQGLKRKALPEVDDGLAQTVGLESLEALRERIGEVLAMQKRGERRRAWRRALLDQLEAALDPNDLPPTLVSAALREDVNRFAYSMAMQGMPIKPEEVNWSEIASRLEPGVRRRVLDDLVLEQLADRWSVETPEEAVDAVILEQAERLGIPPAEHRANLTKEDKLEDLRHAARMSVTVDEMIRRAGGEVEP